MALVKLVGPEQDFFHIPTARRAHLDWEAVNFGRTGEFSPWADRAFNRHCKRLKSAVRFYSNLGFNGRLKEAVLKEERYWY